MEIDYSHHYRKWHNDTPEHIQEVANYYHRILGPHLPEDKAGPVLDVGCGMGFALIALKQLGFQNVAGIDSNAGQAAYCQSKGLDVTLCSDSAGFLRNCSGRYQLVLALDLLEHIPVEHQIEFATAIATALKSGGILIGTTPNANSSLAARWRYLDWTHQTGFTEHSMDFLLHNAGFAEVKVMEVEYCTRPGLWWLPVTGSGRHWWAFRFFRMWRRLEMMAELGPGQGRRVPLSPNLLVVARKKQADASDHEPDGG